MASQQYIFQHESDLIDVGAKVEQLRKAAQLEADFGKNESNQLAWETVAFQIDTLITILNKARKEVLRVMEDSE